MKIKKILVIGTSMFLLLTAGRAQKNLAHLKAFAKAYGYVKYFHPSTESTKINWNKFSAYGANKILECVSDQDLLLTLNELYKPIGPTIDFSSELEEFELKKITPKDLENYKLTYWQHSGVSIGMDYRNYESVLVNQSKIIDDTTTIMSKPIFDEHPKIGERITMKIANQLYCFIPLALYSNEVNSYPKSESLNALQSLLDSFQVEPTSLALRLGNVINVYNVIQHFYPYFEEVSVDWNREFELALNQCFTDKNEDDHLITLQKFMAKLRDGHTWIWQGKSPYQYYPDIHWEWVQDSLVITKVLNDSLNIKVGNVVTRINNQSAKAYFENVNSRISHSTKTYLNHSNKTRSLSAKINTELTVEINSEEITLRHTKNIAEYQRNLPKIQNYLYKLIQKDIMYINLASIHLDTLTKILPQLKQMKGLICDFRGRNLNIWDFLSHFSENEIPDGFIFRIPKIIYPDQEKIVGFKDYQYPYEPKAPYLGDIKTVFIVDGQVKSAGESFINTVKHANLATIVGERTAGVNGMINPFKVLGDITIWWTGAKATNPDGSQFHCIGVEPDVYVEKTIQGIREERDEFLEKAIEVVIK